VTKTLIVRIKGGAGSGNYGHAGRPGLVGGSGGSGGSGTALSIDAVCDRIRSDLPTGQTFRGISDAQYESMQSGEDLRSHGQSMLAQAGKVGELQVTNNLSQAVAHANGGVVLAIPKSLTAAKRQFADIRRVVADRLALSDIMAVYSARTGDRLK